MFKNLPSFVKIIPILLVLLVISYYLSLKETKNPEQYFVGAQNSPQTKKSPGPQTFEITNPELTNFPGRWAMAVKDLKRKETYLLNADEKFSAASIYKLAVMYRAYDAIKKGELKYDDVLSDEKVYLDSTLAGNTSSPSPVNQTDAEFVSFTAEEALRLMITISDNYAAILLADRLGWKNIDDFLEAQNLASIDLTEDDSPTVTARAVMELLERIYNFTAVDHESSRQMQDLLFTQQVNDRIPKYLPENTKVAHKTGELEAIRHDAGIVIGQKSDYIFVFLTETNNPEEARENIALISKKIFDALESQ